MKMLTLLLLLCGHLAYAEDAGTGSSLTAGQYPMAFACSIMSDYLMTDQSIDGIGVISTKCGKTHNRLAAVYGSINAPIDIVWNELRDYSNYREFVPRCAKNVVLSDEMAVSFRRQAQMPSIASLGQLSDANSVSRDTALVYSELNIGFPVGRICSVLELIADSAGRTIKWRKLCSPLSTYQGVWLLRPHNGGTVVVCVTEFRLSTWIPPFLIDTTVRHFFPRIIRTLRERVHLEETTKATDHSPALEAKPIVNSVTAIRGL